MILFTLMSLLCGSIDLRSEVVIDAVGDIMLDRYVGREIKLHGTRYPLAKVRNVLERADLVYGNLECPLTTSPKALLKPFVFRVPPSNAATLKLRKPLLVSVANNHSLDCGQPGLAETERTLDRHRISWVGAEKNGIWQPRFTRIRGLRIAWIAYSDFPDDQQSAIKAPSAISLEIKNPKSKIKNSAVSYWDEAMMCAAVAEARKHADIVIVCPHWGIEGKTQPSPRQREEAQKISNAGADLILGCHPHVLQPVERIGKTWVAYSMGDFVFDTRDPKERQTAIFRIVISKKGVKGLAEIPAWIEGSRPTIAK